MWFSGEAWGVRTVSDNPCFGVFLRRQARRVGMPCLFIRAMKSEASCGKSNYERRKM